MRLSIISLLLALSLLFTSCGSNSGTDPDPPEPKEKLAKTIDADAEESGETVAPFTILSGGETLAEDVSEYRTEDTEKGTSKSYTIRAEGRVEKTQSVDFSNGAPVTFSLVKKDTEPGMATLTVNPLYSGETYTDAVLTDTGTGDEIGDGGKEDIDGEIGSEQEIRISGPDVQSVTITLVFDETKTVPVELEKAEPETVTLSITPEIGEFTARTRSRGDEFTRFSVTVNGTKYVNERPDGALLQEGESLSVEVPAGTSVDVSGRFVYEQESRSQEFGRHRSLATGEVSVSANGDDDIPLSMTHIPACSDEINNDDSDNAVDANDSGCVDGFASRDPSSPDFEYEPEDDNEILSRFRRAGSSGSDLRFVSSKKGERFQPLFSATLPKSALFAVGQIDVYIKNGIDEKQTGEEFALWVICSTKNEDPRGNKNTRTTAIVPDDQSVNGFRTSLVNGMTRTWVEDGNTCGFYAIDGTKARGEDPGNGNDDIFFSTEDENGASAISIFYEAEEVH